MPKMVMHQKSARNNIKNSRTDKIISGETIIFTGTKTKFREATKVYGQHKAATKKNMGNIKICGQQLKYLGKLHKYSGTCIMILGISINVNMGSENTSGANIFSGDR